jgi:hypothetical protein
MVYQGQETFNDRMQAEPDKTRDLTLDERAELSLRVTTYPDLVAAVTYQEGFENWPLTFNEFTALPDALVLAWEDLVYKVNPHWNPAGQPLETKEKKA